MTACTCPICRPATTQRSPLASLPGWDRAEQTYFAEQHNEKAVQQARDQSEWGDVRDAVGEDAR